jgi:hypothetical protein
LALASCSEDNVEPNHFNPISPLPSRVDAVVVPTAAAAAATEKIASERKMTPSTSEAVLGVDASDSGESDDQTTDDLDEDVPLGEEQTSLTSEDDVSPVVVTENLTIETLGVCARIFERIPGDCGKEFSFAQTQKVYTYMKLADVKPPQTLKHIYYYNGKKVATVQLPIKYPAMRTWSQQNLESNKAIGKWKVVVMTEEANNKNTVLATREFTVTP